MFVTVIKVSFHRLALAVPLEGQVFFVRITEPGRTAPAGPLAGTEHTFSGQWQHGREEQETQIPEPDVPRGVSVHGL